MIGVNPVRYPRPNRDTYDYKPPRSAMPMVDPVLELWTAVFQQHIQDSMSTNGQSHARKFRDEGRKWLRGQLYPADFRLILGYCNLDESWYFSRILPALEAKWQELDGGTRH